MGIRGLTAFINNRNYFDEIQLKDTVVVIDGNSLLNHLYYAKYESKSTKDVPSDVFGGDYDLMAKIYIDFINDLTECNVVPIFVFDGAHEERKMKTFMIRMNVRVENYGPMKTNMPYLGGNIIFGILNDMKMPHIQCDFEADAEIVAIAKLLNCPVVSSDGDFFLNTVPFIPLTSIKINHESKFVSCKLYKVEKLLNDFVGLKRDYLPLVAALLENDYIEKGMFSALLKLKPGYNSIEKKLKQISEWLGRQSDLNGAIENITKYNRDIKNQINSIIEDYDHSGSDYLSFLFEYDMMSQYRDRLRENLNKLKKTKRILPIWLEDNYRKGTISSEVMTILTLEKIFFKVQIEDFTKPSYYKVTMKILETILGLLGKFDSIPTYGRNKNSRFNINTTADSELYVNNPNKFKKYVYKENAEKIEPYLNDPYVALAEINVTDMEYRKNVILNLVGIKSFYGVPREWELFVLVLIYWANQTNESSKSKYMHALIIGAMKFNIIEFHGGENKNFTVNRNSIEVKKEDCSKAMSTLSDYVQGAQYDESLYYKIIHPFAQFQGCIEYIMMLNSLLDFPYDQCRVEKFFKGSFLYNLCVQMENCGPEEFASAHIFYKSDSLSTVYKSIVVHIDELMSDTNKNAAAVGGGLKRKAECEAASRPRPKHNRHDNYPVQRQQASNHPVWRQPTSLPQHHSLMITDPQPGTRRQWRSRRRNRSYHRHRGRYTDNNFRSGHY